MALYTKFYGIAVAVVRLAAIGMKMRFAQLSSKYKLDHDIVFDFLGAGGILENNIVNLFQNSPTNYRYEYGVNAEVRAFDVYNVLSEY